MNLPLLVWNKHTVSNGMKNVPYFAEIECAGEQVNEEEEEQ